MWETWQFCRFKMHNENGRSTRVADNQRFEKEQVGMTANG